MGFRQTVLIAAAIAIGYVSPATAQTPISHSPWAMAAQAVVDHLVSTGQVPDSADVVVSSSTIADGKAVRQMKAGETNEVLDDLQDSDLPQVVRSEVLRCEPGQLRLCRTEPHLVILSFGRHRISGDSAEVLIMAEHHVAQLTSIQRILFRVQLIRSEPGWDATDVEVLGVS